MNHQQNDFQPTLDAAFAQLAAVDIAAYSKSRNAIGGAVTRLSPYVTHGFLSFPQIAKSVATQTGFNPQHKFVFELGWRAYFHHVWAALGNGIFTSLHQGVLPDSAYRQALPIDIQTASTGVPVIDCAVQTLTTTGYLHNHARMWLASYIVHIRKVHWLVGATWMYGHLLDGDLASNTLSWQWVAGTGSSKPYLFNAENVAKYAPASWHSEDTVLDASYAQLDAIARSAAVPNLKKATQAALIQTECPALFDVSHSAIFQSPTLADLIQLVKGRHVYLVHPWSLGELPANLPTDALVLGVIDLAFHVKHPWSAKRWAWVGARMQALCGRCYAPSFNALQALLNLASSVQYAPNPHAAWLSELAHPQLTTAGMPKLFTEFAALNSYYKSFSAWWNKTQMKALE